MASLEIRSATLELSYIALEFWFYNCNLKADIPYKLYYKYIRSVDKTIDFNRENVDKYTNKLK